VFQWLDSKTMNSVGAIISRRALFALPATVLPYGLCRAENLGDVWAEWQKPAAEKRGPPLANGLLLHFEDSEASSPAKKPIALVFAEIARVARWDVLRIGKRADVEDEHAIRFAADQIGRARAAGYGQIVAGGIRRGGWLALLAARLLDVDAAIALAPHIATVFDAHDVLVDSQAGAKAKRIAAFFFEEASLEHVGERQAIAVKHALQAAGATFMIVDRPPDLQEASAAEGGRFVRRYRDCLLQFIQRADSSAGEVQCLASSGYAVGADIDIPAHSVLPREMPADADPAFAPFWGRWEGDDEIGTYLILQAIAVRPKIIYFRIGFSDSPEIRPGATAVSRDVAFQLDGSRRRLYCKLPARHDLLAMTLKSATELEYEVQRTGDDPVAIHKSSIRLRKRGPIP
jgi:hypothetical protein